MLFRTHFNGGKAFDVTVRKGGKSVTVHENTGARKQRLLFRFENVERVFDGGDVGGDAGSTILLKLEGRRQYAYIGGARLYLFTAGSEIQTFTSPIRRGDVPYPYAVDARGRLYLLEERVVIPHGGDLRVGGGDPYRFYYDNSRIHGYRSFGNGPLLYKPDFETYDAWVRETGGKQMPTLSDENGSRPLTRGAYRKIMTDFGRMAGFQRLSITWRRR